MGTVAQGKGPWSYQRLTERLVRWLTQDPTMDPVQITLPERTGMAGQEMELRIKVQVDETRPRDDSRFTKSQETVSFSVSNPEGARIASQLKPAAQNGEYLGSFLPEKGGTYRVKVETQGGQWEESVFVGEPLQDLDGFPNHERLKRISAISQGKTLAPGDGLRKELEALGDSSRKRFIEENRFPLRSNTYVFLLLIGLLTMEWYLRRRWGLI
jgi:hypothetical protein